eukprot:4280733-Amphidinium_carterae.1
MEKRKLEKPLVTRTPVQLNVHAFPSLLQHLELSLIIVYIEEDSCQWSAMAIAPSSVEGELQAIRQDDASSADKTCKVTIQLKKKAHLKNA